MTDLKSTVIGALVGCAVGDAMGAPFEGLWSESIPSSADLLADYHVYEGFPQGQFTDDTQLTIATIESIVEMQCVEPSDIASRIAGLWKHYGVIGPGGACTHAAEHFLATSDWTTMGAPVGQAGNGTAMRTAVLGLWYINAPDALSEEVSVVSGLTHQDPRSIAGGVAIAEASRYLALNESPVEPEEFCNTISRQCLPIDREMGQLIRELPGIMKSDFALETIAAAGQYAAEFDRPIITPFVIPTVLASLYSLIKHPTSWPDAVTEAIRLGGDVDTLGAIVGALAGAQHGIDAIPRNLVDSVQRSDYLHSLAHQYFARIKIAKSS